MDIDLVRRISFQAQHLGDVWSEVARQNTGLAGFKPATEVMFILYSNEKAIVPTSKWPLVKTDVYRMLTCWTVLDDFSYIPPGERTPSSLKPPIARALLQVLEEFCKIKKPADMEAEAFIENALFDPRTLESPSLDAARIFLWAICQMVPLETLSI